MSAVDPRRDDLIVQRVLKLGDNLGVTSIEHRPDKAAGWVPTRWAHKSTLAGIPQAIWETTVIDYSINQPIPPGTFDLAFPPRTFVTDAVLNERYLVRADGSKRPITKRELELERQRKLRSAISQRDRRSLGKGSGLKRSGVMFHAPTELAEVGSAWACETVCISRERGLQASRQHQLAGGVQAPAGSRLRLAKAPSHT